jgi:gas vesicle protein
MADTSKASQGGRSRARASGPATNHSDEDDREQQFDLLTAAIIGAAVGAAVTLLFRTGPSGRRPIAPIVRGAGRGAALAGMAGLQGARWASERAAPGARWAAERGRDGARWAGDRAARGYRVARDRSAEMIDDLPLDDMADSVREYVDNAREAINDVVQQEMSDLRKAVRRQRKRIGI